MNNQVDEIKSRTDIVAIIGERIELKKAGRNFKAICPFHGEKTPSFMVSPELQIFKCFGCFPAGQFVKTPFGYHKIEDVVASEWVVSGKGNLQKVETQLVREYDGDLVKICLANLTEEVSMTGNHNVFVIGGAPLYRNNYKYLSKRLNLYSKYSEEKRLDRVHKYFPIEKLEARNLKKGMTLLYPIDTFSNPIDRLDLSAFITKKWPAHGTKPIIPELDIKVDDNFLKLIGYYIAEGSNHRAYIRFSIGDHEKEFAKDIIKIVNEIFGFEAEICRKHRGKKTGTEISVCNSILANVFENLCGKGAEKKHIPFVLQQLPPDRQSIMLNAIYRGDGFEKKLKNNVKTHRRFITTISRTLSEQLTDILLRTGFYPSRNVQIEKIDKLGTKHKKAFVVSWSVNPQVSRHRHIYTDSDGSKYWLVPIARKKTSSFKGMVYNLRVENDHSYVANTFAVANCGEAGDVFNFLEKYEGMEFPEALKYLADRAGIKLQRTDFGQSSEKEKLIEINTQVVRFYNYLLLEHPVGAKALKYLEEERGLKKETIKEFSLGFSPESSYALKKFLVDKKNFFPADIEKAGVGIPRGQDLYDRFNGRVIFPLFDHRGNPIGFAGRVLPWDKRETGKYINSPETPLYHKSSVLYGLNLTRGQIKKKKVAIVVEGELDLISSWQAGIKNIVAIKGSTLTEEQVKLLSRFAQKFILALDSDVAGDAAARRGIKVAGDIGVEVKVAEITGFKDPDEAARGNIEGYKKDLINARGVYDYFIDSVFARISPESGSGKSKISKEIIPILGEIGDKIVQSHYANVIARKLEVPLEAVLEELGKISDKNVVSPESTSSFKTTEGAVRRELLEERFLSLAFQSDPKKLLSKKTAGLIALSLNKRLVEEYAKFDSGKDFDVTKFGESLPAELFDGFAKMVLSDNQNLLDNPDELSRELELVGKELKIHTVKEKLKLLASQMRETEESGEADKLLKAQNEFNKLAKSLSGYEEERGGGLILNEDDR